MSWKEEKYKRLRRDKLNQTLYGNKMSEKKAPQPGPRAIFERDYLNKYPLEEAIEKYVENQNGFYDKETIGTWAKEILAKRKQRDDDDAR